MRVRWIAAGAILGLGLLGAIPLIALNQHDRPDSAIATLGADAAPEAADSEAVVFDESTAKLVAQDESALVWTDAAGTGRAEVSLVPVRVLRNGEWIPASNEVTDTGDSIVAANHPLAPAFPEVLGDEPIVTIDSEDHRITFTLEDQRAGAVAAFKSADDGSTVTYADAAGGADAVYEVKPGAVKEQFILHERPATPVTFAWTIDAPGLSLEANEYGGADFVSPTGEVVANVPPPAMWDSAGEEEARGSDLVNVDFKIEDLGGGRYRFALQPDAVWMNDPAREFPVYVDPSVATGPTSLLAIKFDGSTYSALRIGNPAQPSGWTAWRSVVLYPYLGTFGSGASQVKLNEKRITGASLHTTKTGGTANCYDGGLWEATAIAYSGMGSYLSEFPNCATGDANGTAMSAFYAAANARGATAAYVMLAGDEGYSYSYKELTSTMTFTFVDRAMVTGVADGSPHKVNATDDPPLVYADDVVLQATGKEYTASGQEYRYTITLPGGGKWVSPWAPDGPYRVPDTVLVPNASYSYAIETRDKFIYESPVKPYEDTGAILKFKTRTSPLAPTDVTVGGVALDGTARTTGPRPELGATVISTAGSTVQALFTVLQNGIVVAESLPGSPVNTLDNPAPTGPSTVVLPFDLVPGAEYTVLVQTFDGHMASTTVGPLGSFTGPLRAGYIEIPGGDDIWAGANS